MGVDRAGLGGVERREGALGELVARHGAARALDQVRQDIELVARQLDRRVAAVDRPGVEIDLELGPAHHAPGRAGRDPEPGLHPRDQLIEEERLGHVVDGAQREAAHALGDVGAGGEHDDRRVRAAVQRLEQLEPGHHGQHQIEHHEVGWPRRDRRAGLRAVAHQLDLEPGAAEAAHQLRGDPRIVLDQAASIE